MGTSNIIVVREKLKDLLERRRGRCRFNDKRGFQRKVKITRKTEINKLERSKESNERERET